MMFPVHFKVILCFQWFVLWLGIAECNSDLMFYMSEPRSFTVTANGHVDLQFLVHTRTKHLQKCWLDTIPRGKRLPFTIKYCDRFVKLEGSPPNCTLHLRLKLTGRDHDLPRPFRLYLENDDGEGHVDFSIETRADNNTDDVNTDTVVITADALTTDSNYPPEGKDGQLDDSDASDKIKDFIHSTKSGLLLLGGLLALFIIVISTILGVCIKRRGGTSLAEPGQRIQMSDLTADRRARGMCSPPVGQPYSSAEDCSSPPVLPGEENIYSEIRDDALDSVRDSPASSESKWSDSWARNVFGDDPSGYSRSSPSDDSHDVPSARSSAYAIHIPSLQGAVYCQRCKQPTSCFPPKALPTQILSPAHNASGKPKGLSTRSDSCTCKAVSARQSFSTGSQPFYCSSFAGNVHSECSPSAKTRQHTGIEFLRCSPAESGDCSDAFATSAQPRSPGAVSDAVGEEVCLAPRGVGEVCLEVANPSSSDSEEDSMRLPPDYLHPSVS